MEEYINEEGDLYTLDEINQTAKENNATFDEIIKRNKLTLKPKKQEKVKVEEPGKPKPVAKEDAGATVKSTASKLVKPSSASQDNPFGEDKSQPDFISNLQKVTQPKPKFTTPVSVKPPKQDLRPISEYQDKVKKEEEGSFSNFLKEGLDSAISTITKSIYKAPEYAYNFIASNITDPIANTISESVGGKAIHSDSDKIMDTFGIKNIPAEILQKRINESNKILQDYSNKNGVDPLTAIENGNYLGALKLTVGGTIQSFPMMAAAMLSGGSVPALAGIAASTAISKAEELKITNPEMDVKTRTNAGAVSGLLEAYLGELFTGASGRIVQKILTDKGTKAGSKIISNGLMGTLESAIEKNPMIGVLGEVAEESGVELGNQLNEINAGVRKELDYRSIANAGIIATGMAGTNTIPIYAAKGYMKMAEYNQVKAVNKEINTLTNQLSNPYISPSDKKVISSRVNRLVDENKSIAGTSLEKIKALPENIKTELNTLNTDLDDLKSKYLELSDNSELPVDVKKAMSHELELQAKELHNRKSSIIEGNYIFDDFNKLSEKEQNDFKNEATDYLIKENEKNNDTSTVKPETIDRKAVELYNNQLRVANAAKEIDLVTKLATTGKAPEITNGIGENKVVEIFETPESLQEAYNKYHAVNKFEGTAKDVTKEAGFTLGDQIVINKAVAQNFEEGDSVGRHELLHKILKSSFSDKEAGIKLKNNFLNVLSTKERDVIEKRLKDRGYTEENLIDAPDEYLTQFFEALDKKEIQYSDTSFLTMWKTFLQPIYKKLGFRKLDFKSGADVYNFIKDYHKSVSKGGLSERAIALKEKGIDNGTKEAFSKTIAQLKTELNDLEENEGDYDPNEYDQEVRRVEGELKRAIAKEATAKPIIKKEVSEEDNVKEIIKNESGSISSNKVQQIYEEKGLNGADEIIKLFRPITNKIVNKRKDAPGFDEELLTDEIETGEGGIIYLIKSYKPEKGVPLAAYINKQLPLRAIAASRRVLDQQFNKDASEEKGLMATETADQGFAETAKEKPKYKNALESKVFEPEVLKTMTGKIVTVLRTLKSRIDAPVTLNRTVTPIIAEIRDEIGKQLDIDIKTAMGGKKDGQLKKFALKNKRYFLENMTTTFLMGKDGQGGVPQAIQKQVDGKWVSYPEWVGKKIDREKTTTDQAGRTSGAELVRRLPNVANNISDEVYLAQLIGPDGNPIRGRKESWAKAMAEESAFDIINNDFENNGPILEEFKTNQERQGVEIANNIITDFARQSDRGNIKSSKVYNNFSEDQKKLFNENINELSIQLNPFLNNINKDLSINRIFSNIFDPLLINNKKAFSKDEIADLIKDFTPWLRQMRDIDNSIGLYLEDENFDFNKFIENIAIANEEIPLEALNMSNIEKGLYSANNVNAARDTTKNMFRHWYDTLGAEEAVKMMVYLNGNYKYNTRIGKTVGLDVNESGVVFETGINVPKNKSSKQIAKNAEDYWDNLVYASLPGGKTKSNINLLERIKVETAEARSTDSASKSYTKKDYTKRKAQAEYYRNITEKMFEFYFNKENKISNADKAIMVSQMNGSTESANRKSAILTYEYITPNGEDVGALRYEHMIPANKVLASLVKAYTKVQDGKVSREALDGIWKNYEAALIPVTMDKMFGKVNLESNMVPGWNEDLPAYYRYYNYATFGKEGLLPITNVFTGEIIGEEFVNASNAMRAGVKNNTRIKAIIDVPKFSKTPKGISVFDFDDTIGLTKGSVLYTMPDGSTGKLNAEEFAKKGGNMLDAGSIFDFSEFSKVVDGKPGPMVEKMKKMIGKFGSENFFILTARPANAAGPIHEFLSSIGIDIPLENITGLGNSTAQAKADWMTGKATEGYNDFYFSDDAIQNVTAVKNALDVLDVKSKIQQAKIKFSKTIGPEFNKIIAKNTGIGPAIEYSDIVAKRKGAGKNLFDLYVPASAADFELLLYNFIGKGKEGDAQKKFFSDALLKPYANGNDLMDAARQSIKNNYKELINAFPGIAKKLEKLTPDGNFTYDQALRVAMWNGSDVEIPGLSKRDTNELTSLVNNDTELHDFMAGLIVLGRQGNGWTKPGENWDANTIISDLHNLTEGEGRKQFLSEFIDNAEQMFGKWENGKLTGPNMNKIEAIYGTDVRESIEDVLYRMTNGKNRSQGTDAITNKWLNWVSGSTGTIMFLNTRSAALQLIGAVNYLNLRDNNPIAAGAAFANQPQYWKDFARIWNSDKMKERRGGLKEDVAAAEIANAAATSKNKPTAVVSYLLKIGYTPTQIADSFAIASGGAPFYRNRIKSYLKEGQTEVEAEKNAWNDFTKVSDETQQSGDPRDISKQQASGAGRLLLTFQNTAMQQSRIVKKSFLDLKNGRGDAKTHIAKITYYLAIQNLMFSALQQGLFAVLPGLGDDKEDDEAKKKRLKEKDNKAISIANDVIDTVVRGTGLLGGVMVTLKNVIRKYMEEEPKKYKADYTKVLLEGVNISPPIGSKIRKVYSALQQTKFDKDLIKERGWGVMQDGRVHLGPMYSITGKAVEVTTNFPMDRLVNKIENTSQIMNSQNKAWQRVLVGLGWNPRSLGIGDTPGDTAIEAAGKATRKEEGIIKSKETRERTRDSIKALPIAERIKLKREAALKRREEKLKKRKRKMG
jgi:hypothetical protein